MKFVGSTATAMDNRRGGHWARLAPLISILVSGCLGPRYSAPQPPAVDVPPPAADETPVPYAAVWTARPEVALFDGVSRSYAIERAFTRLDVVGQDSLGVRLRCEPCSEAVEGYADPEDLLLHPVPPEVAAWGELPEFALAIRTAAEQGDLQALRPVMSPDFSFSFVGIQTLETALAAWEAEQFSTLRQVPELLDRGLATLDGRVWSAPPEFVSDAGYTGLRTGFRRRTDGRWEWLYLIRDVTDRG